MVARNALGASALDGAAGQARQRTDVCVARITWKAGRIADLVHATLRIFADDSRKPRGSDRRAR